VQRRCRQVVRETGRGRGVLGGKLTDDDLAFMAGSKEQFVGRLQERYGIAKEVAQKQTDEWLQAQAEV